MADDEEIHHTRVRTVLGSSRREQRWDLAHEVDISTVLGKSFFDLRLARPMGETDVEISISCFLGSVELLVPVGTRVTLEGSTFLAGASSDVSGEDEAPPSNGDGVDLTGKQLPRLDIAATAILGRVRVRTPDRPTRAKPQRFARFRRNTSSNTPPLPRRALADILADADEDERLTAATAPTPTPAPVAASEPAPTPLPTPDAAPVDADIGGTVAEATEAPVDVAITESAPEAASMPVDVEIERSAVDAGPVDMTFAKADPVDFDDFDPADFPDEVEVAAS